MVALCAAHIEGGGDSLKPELDPWEFYETRPVPLLLLLESRFPSRHRCL